MRTKKAIKDGYISGTATPKERREQENALAVSSTVSRLYVSVKEVAFMLNISPSLVREYEANKLLKKVELPHPSGIGFINRVLFDIDDVMAFAKRYRHA